MFFLFFFLILIPNIFSNTYTCILVNSDENLIQCMKLNPYNNQIQNFNPNIEYFYKLINNQNNYENNYNHNPLPYINHMDELHEEY